MIFENEYRSFLQARDLALNTIDNYISSIRRIEREHGVNLEEELDKDQLKSLVDRLTYTRADEATGRPNPSNIAVDPTRLFSHLGWYRRALERYRDFRLPGSLAIANPTLVDDVIEPEIEEAGRTFKLEEDLQIALRKNLNQLEDGLTIADNGKEYYVEAGFIDILARDKAGRWVVIELKAGDAKADAIAQILSYITSVSEEKKSSDVRGILVASDFIPRVRLAARAVPSLSLQKYRFNFQFDKEV